MDAGAFSHYIYIHLAAVRGRRDMIKGERAMGREGGGGVSSSHARAEKWSSQTPKRPYVCLVVRGCETLGQRRDGIDRDWVGRLLMVRVCTSVLQRRWGIYKRSGGPMNGDGIMKAKKKKKCKVSTRGSSGRKARKGIVVAG